MANPALAYAETGLTAKKNGRNRLLKQSRPYWSWIQTKTLPVTWQNRLPVTRPSRFAVYWRCS